MCILIVLRDRVAGWPLVVGSNRDEFRDRPWDPPRRDGALLAPRDRRAGGTWIGLHRRGLLVAVTNRPDPDPDPGRPSRGLLALGAMREGAVDAALDHLRDELDRERRNAFHALVADTSEAHVLAHPGPDGAASEVRPVPDGLHTLTNLRGLDELEARGALAPVDVPPGAALGPTLAAMRRVLATHDDAGPGGREAICKHGEDRGTLSSTIVALPARADAEPLFLMACGAPCETPYRSFGGEPERAGDVP